MRQIRTILTAVFLLLCNNLYAQNDFVDGVELTSIKAPWAMRILSNDLDITDVKLRPGDEHASYFMMTSGSTNLNVSVFVERADKCKTSDECRDYVLGLGNPAWGKYQDLKKGRIKDFSYFEFYRPEVMGEPLKMFDMYAQYVAQGYWIDLHISKVLYKSEDHLLFEKVINSIVFAPKTGAATGTFEALKTEGEKTSASWLGLWGSSKCRESYDGLSSLTKAETPEKSWTDYCARVNENLGANRSRKLIGIAITRSLMPKTDRPLAILAYHSDFTNRTTVTEIVALLLEKDGKWLISNYLPR